MRARILLVMRYSNAKVVSDFLKKEGYEVIYKEDLQELVGVIERENLDLVIADVSDMPKHVWNLITRLKEKDVRFIVINKPTKRVVLPAVTVFKPISKAELLKIIETLL